MGSANFFGKSAFLVATLALTVLLCSACSDVNFDQGSGAATSQNAGDAEGNLNQPNNPGDDANGQIGQNNDPNGTGGTGTGTGGTGPVGTGDPGTGPVNNPPGGTTSPGGVVDPGTPLAPATVIPLVRFIGPPCIRGTNCLVIFELDRPYALQIDYDWVTNDTAFQTYPQPAPDVLIGRPNYHYVPTGGHITFQPGVIRKEVYIQNINPDNTKIQIWVKMRNCMYGGIPNNCSAFFR